MSNLETLCLTFKVGRISIKGGGVGGGRSHLHDLR